MSSSYISSSSNKGLIENVPISKIIISEQCYSYRRTPMYVSKGNSSTGDQDSSFEDLRNSIMQHGLLYPLILRILGDRYELLAGRKRLCACQQLGWRKVLCNVIEATDKEAFEISLNENIHTSKIEPIEEAEAFRKYVLEYGWGGITELASKINKSKSYVTKKIKLLELPKNVISLIDDGIVSPTVAEELLPIDDESKQSKLAQLIRDKQLSKSRVRNIVTDLKGEMPDFDGTLPYPTQTKIMDIDRKTQRSFEQAITALRLAMNKISNVIEDNEDNWIVYERLMHSKLLLHQQIDLLIKDKKKL